MKPKNHSRGGLWHADGWDEFLEGTWELLDIELLEDRVPDTRDKGVWRRWRLFRADIFRPEPFDLQWMRYAFIYDPHFKIECINDDQIYLYDLMIPGTAEEVFRRRRLYRRVE